MRFTNTQVITTITILTTEGKDKMMDYIIDRQAEIRNRDHIFPDGSSISCRIVQARSPVTTIRRQLVRLNWTVDGILTATMRPSFPTHNVITKGPKPCNAAIGVNLIGFARHHHNADTDRQHQPPSRTTLIPRH